MEQWALVEALQLRWLNRRRVEAYGWIVALAGLLSLWQFWRWAMASGSDFQAFWSAARLTVQGHPEQAYNLASVAKLQQALGQVDYFAFVNPPPFLLPIAPLGWLPYPLAWWVWVLATYAMWLAVSRRFVPGFTGPIAGFPGALIAAWHAQTGLFMSAIQAGAAVLLRSRPFLAGCCVGALVMKPHLAVLFPVAFIAGRQWRAFAGAIVGALVLIILSWAVFGTQTLLAYPQSWNVSRALMENGDAPFFLRQCTIYAALWLLVGPVLASWGQGIATLACLWITWQTWRKDWPLEAKLAVLLSATPLATPYLFNYDLPFLILPVIWLANEARRNPSGPWARTEVFALYLAPLATRALALPLGISLMPWVLVWQLAAILRQARLSGGRAQAAAA